MTHAAMDENDVLVVGCGPMAVDYARVLRALGRTPVVVGRGEGSAERFTAATGLPVSRGGLDRWLEGAARIPAAAIVATGERWIGAAARALIARGARHLLVEKPGGFDAEDIRAVEREARAAGARVFVGYNRRFYASVGAARRMIAEDGGVTSFSFEFTEWSHVITPLEKEEGVKAQWFLANSTHVIDLAFHLGGEPVELAAFTAPGTLAWHPGASVFAGAGVSRAGALFSYQANWEAPGRWGVEVLTRKRRLVLRPLERLQVQKLGSVALDFAEIDDALDQRFKPGLHAQVEAFLRGEGGVLPTIHEQAAVLPWYLKIRAAG